MKQTRAMVFIISIDLVIDIVIIIVTSRNINSSSIHISTWKAYHFQRNECGHCERQPLTKFILASNLEPNNFQ